MREMVPIGMLADVTLGKMLQPSSKVETDELRPYLRAAHVQPFGRINFSVTEKLMWFSKKDTETLTLRAGDAVIVEGGAGFGRAAYLTQDLAGWGFQNSIIRLRSDSADMRFLVYTLSAALDSGAIGIACNAATFAHFTAEKVEAFRVPHHDRAVQQRIGDYLDHETGEIDAMIATLDELAGRLEERRDAAILRELQNIPKRSQLVLAVDVVSGSGFPANCQGVSTEELPFYKVGSMSSAVNGYLGDDENTVSRTTAAKLGARVIPAGSILMAKIGAALMLARFVQTTKPACIDNNMQALVPREGIVDPRFLGYAMSEVSIPALVKNGPVPTVDVMAMKMTHIVCPSNLAEQKCIAGRLDEETARINAMLGKVAELKALLIERRAALITDVVTGKKEVA